MVEHDGDSTQLGEGDEEGLNYAGDGNSEDDDENALLLSTICRLEVENLRMRKVMNNYGFNLEDRIVELEIEKRELIKLMKSMKPDEDPSKFSVSEHSKFVNVDFFLSDESSLNKRSCSENSGICSSSSRRPFENHLQPTDQQPVSASSETTQTAEPYSKTDCSINVHSLSLSDSEDDSSGPKRVKRNSLRRHSYLSKSRRLHGAQDWDTSRDIEMGDTWRDLGENSDRQDVTGEVDVNIGSKRQSTEIAFSSMRLSMQNPILENSIQQNFLEFYIIGEEQSILSGEKEPEISQQQPTEILNRYPTHNTVFMGSIANFAFPQGSYLHLTRSVACARVVSKRKPPQYHIMQFSDARGVPTFACCLTVTRVQRLRPSNAQHCRLVANLTPLLTRIVARQVIVKFLRHVVVMSPVLGRKQVVINKDGVVVGFLRPRSLSAPPPASPTKATSPSLSFRKFKNTLFNRLGGATADNHEDLLSRRRSSVSSVGSAVGENLDNGRKTPKALDLQAKRDELSPKSGFARTISLSRDARDHDSEDVSETSDDDNSTRSPPSSPTRGRSRSYQSPSSKEKRLPKMKSNRNQAQLIESSCDHFLISQRAYVLLSAKPLHTFLFQILEKIAEREEKDVVGKVGIDDLVADQDEGEGGGHRQIDEQGVVLATDANVMARDKFLKYVQCYSLEGSASACKRTKKVGTLRLNFPSYIDHQIKFNVNRISVEEWKYAAIFSLLSPTLILYLLNSLILEKSIIVYGSNISLVSSLTSAIVQLLQPFTWEGVFIPVIPANAIEILEAPVPFVVGTTLPFDLQNISPAASVLRVDEVLRCHLSTVGPPDEMMGPKCLHRSVDPTAKMPINQNLRNELEAIHHLLYRGLPACFQAAHQQDIQKAELDMFNFQLSYFFNEGILSTEARLAIKHVSAILVEHNSMFTGDITEKDGGWRKYGVYDPFSDAYNFFPQWFLDHQVSILEFQKSLVHTQLFYSYVDRVKLLYTEKEFFRRFIAEFLSYKYKNRRKKTVKQLS